MCTQIGEVSQKSLVVAQKDFWILDDFAWNYSEASPDRPKGNYGLIISFV